MSHIRRCTILGLSLIASAWAQEGRPVVPLWPNGAPGSEGKTAPEALRIAPPGGDHIVSSVHKPSITLYLPKANPTGVAVVIAPGGGHSELWMDHEGYNVAEWLSEHGIAGLVLKYRLAREKGSTYTVEGESLADTQRAIRVARSRAAEWGIDPERIGVMGFSAGGELAALAGSRYGDAPAGADDVGRLSDKPAFQALLYPAIPRDMKFSKESPQAFLACGADDRQNISQGLPELYLAMKRAGASAELHVYAHTGHGFGVRATNHGPSSAWTTQFYAWLEATGMIRKTAANAAGQ
jgi:endo-1,4-beta-xylanase